jgi:hypothetical protein
MTKSIAEEIQDEYENLHLDIEELIESPYFFENTIVAKMKKIVPEFKSMNRFEVLENSQKSSILLKKFS